MSSDLAVQESRRAASGAAIEARRASMAQQPESMGLGIGLGIDQDDFQYRRLTNGAKLHTRDLTPLSHDRQLEVSWYLFEQNPFAHRLTMLMTDLIIGEGVQVDITADDERIQDVVDQFMGRNQLAKLMRSFYMSNSLNGELILPCIVNPFSGIPVLGFVDSIQVKAVVPLPDNILVLDKLLMKGSATMEERPMQIIRENPVTGRLEGDVFFHRINALPNSLRGRSDLATLADWLDLYDQFMFAEVERINLMSAFAWDYTIEGAETDAAVQDKIRKLPKLKPGAVFGHNEKESLEPRTPDLKAGDRSEVARLLRVHIAGSYGFPVSYLGDVDSNRATIEGQNDILLKTPAARQKEFAGLLDLMVRFAIEQSTAKNPALFRDIKPPIGGQKMPWGYRISMPEIAAKDIARVGTIMASVGAAMDTSVANRTTSRQMAIRVMAAMITQLGIDADPSAIASEIDAEADERQELADQLQSELARRSANPNQPVPDDLNPNE